MCSSAPDDLGAAPARPEAELFVQFRQALADCRELYRQAAQVCVESHAASLGRSPQEFAELIQDLERGLLVKILVEMAQCDWHWSTAEYALARELFEHVWGTRLEGESLKKSLRQVVERSGSLGWGNLFRPFAQLPPFRERVGELETVLMRLANLVAKIDGHTSQSEAQRLRWIQGELERHLVPLPLDAGRPDAAPAAGRAEIEKVSSEVSRARPDAVAGGASRPPAEKSRPEQLAEALRELDELIGLGGIKHEVRELVNFLKVQQERERLGLPRTSVSLHMVFCGNPGTGKTTVARLVGRIFGGMGILARGHLVEADRSGLVAKYAGQTGPKTHQKIDEALDGVLFIDEAYSLVAAQGDDPYGHEAVQALLKRMEDERHRLVVVLAGYPEPMAQLLDSNPGLASRFSRRLDFADYSACELGQVFQVMCERNHYVLPAATRLKLLLGFQYLLDHRDRTFGNGRLARNLFELAIRRLATRIADIAPLTAPLLTTLEEADIDFAGVPEETFDGLLKEERRLMICCPGCGHNVRFKWQLLGRRAQCKRCGQVLELDWGEPAV